MEIYDSLLGAVCDEYDRVTLIKKSERGEVTLIRHRASGNRYIFRHFSGSSEVYRKLLTVSCPNLPQIMEVGEKQLFWKNMCKVIRWGRFYRADF